MTTLQPATGRALRRLVLDKQIEGRVPGMAAGVSRHGSLVWHDGVGALDLDEPEVAPGPDDQFLIASNSKTFTAVLIMQLRDQGLLSLDDRLDGHLPGTQHGDVTIRQMLIHASGMQREPVGDIWATLEPMTRASLLTGFEQAERVHRPHHMWHYSNLMYALLGEVAGRLVGTSWWQAVNDRILRPLGMTNTSVGFTGRHSGCYFVPPYSDVPQREPVLSLDALDPAGGLASTLTDLATWQGFWASPSDEVLAPDTVEEMCQPQIAIDRTGLTAAMGLGVFVMRMGERTYVGHTGGMPGQITGVFTHRESGTGGIALMNATHSPDPAALAASLAGHVLEHDPEERKPWRPGTEVPEEFVPILGRWYTEGHPLIFSVREGRLQARAEAAPPDLPASRFERVAPDTYRTVSGREHGELLRIERAADGAVRRLSWATYPVTREPLAFGEHPES